MAMTKLSKVFLTATLAALFLGLAACASQKEPAEQALAAIEKKFQDSGAEIQKYLPERHAEIAKSIDSLRQSIASKSYGDVVAGAKDVENTLKGAVAEARIERAKAQIAMETEWTELSKSMPAMIAAMDKKIDSQHGRPPKGMTKDAWKAMIADYDAARDAWSKAAAEISRATFEASVLSARGAKEKIASIMESLGVKAS
jgi:uncharacterized protein YgfB (UPF0149 family)